MNIPIFGKDNPFSKFFRFGRVNDEHTREDIEAFKNSQGYSQEEIEFGRYPYAEYDDNGYYGMASINIQFEQFFRQKWQRIFKYREMSYYPDINDAIDIICDEAMCEDTEGRVMTLNIKEELPDYIEEQLRDYWDYLMDEVFVVNETAWDMFKRWLIDGELFCELILDDDGENIIDFKILPAQTMIPIYANARIAGFSQNTQINYFSGAGGGDSGIVSSNDNSQTQASTGYSPEDNTGRSNDGDVKDEVKFDKDQIIYIPYQKTGRNPIDVVGFLESSIKIYNQLKYLEDAVVVYRIVRAPERRIWNIAVGRMPKGKAEQYIRGIVQRYRKKIHYDPTTGAMDSSQNFQAMTEDFWFARDENGEGTSVETLEGGCFSMDTRVSLLDGRELAIRDIESEIAQGKTLWTYSCHPITGEVVPGLISWAGVTHKSAKVMKLTLDNGETITCTLDHKFPVYGHGFVRADKLDEGSSIIPLYRKSEPINTTSKLTYEQFFDNDNKEWKYTHRMVSDYLRDDVVEYTEYNTEYSNGTYNVRHHINHDRFDNSPDNLQFMSWADHRKLHQDIGFPKGVGTKAAQEKMLWIKSHDTDAYNDICARSSKNSLEFWNSLTPKEYDVVCDSIRSGVVDYISSLSDEERIVRGDTSRRNFQKGTDRFHYLMDNDSEFRSNVINKRRAYWTDDIREQRRRDSSINARNVWINNGIVLRQRHKEAQQVVFSYNMLKYIIDLVKDKTSHEFTAQMVTDAMNSSIDMVDSLVLLNKDKSVPNWSVDMGFTINLVKKCVKQFGYTSWVDFRKNESLHNHRIIKIEYLDDEIEVGTLTIDSGEKYHDYHTFALSVGVFTKNSNLGEMSDVYYFERKLHQTLKLPSSRWGNQSDETSDSYTTGKSGEITREEIKFSRFVERLQKKFTRLFMDSFLTLLRLQGFDDTYIDESLYQIRYTQSNLWKQYKELELLESRFGILGAIETYIYKPQENDNGPFSMEFVLKNWFLMSEEEYNENDELVRREKEAAKMAGLDSGFGDDEEGGDEFGAEGGDEFGAEGGDEFGAEGGDEFGADMGGDDFGADMGGETGEFDA